MLEIKNLSVNFKNQKVLNDLNITLSEGEVVGILGKNGAGKTTFFESLYQSLPHSGEMIFNNDKLRRDRISYLETDNYFYPYITGQEYLDYFKTDSGFEDLVQKFRLPLSKYVQDYSSGMKKKIALIGMLMLDKPINILDEPFNGVDFEGVHILYEMIAELKVKNKIVLISSHIIETLFHTCDKIAFLENGRIEKIVGKESFSQLYNFKF